MSKENKGPGWYDYWEYGCVDDTFIVSTVPDVTKKESEGGIIFATEADVSQDQSISWNSCIGWTES